MGAFRVIVLAVLIVATPSAAGAQFGGGQGELPSGPLVWPPARPPALPPACQQLLALRDETQKHGMAIQKANERRASVQEACRLFKLFLSAETRFVNSLEENSQTCSVSPDAIKRVKEAHAKAEQVGKQVCDTAAQGPRPRVEHWPLGDYWWPGDRMPGR